MCKEIIKIKLRPKMFVETEFDTRPTSKDRPKFGVQARQGQVLEYAKNMCFVCIHGIPAMYV